MSSEKVLAWGNGIEAEFGLFRNPSATFNSKKIKYLFFDSKQLVNPSKPSQKYIYYVYTKNLKKNKNGEIVYPTRFKRAIEFLDGVDVEKAGKSCLGKIISGKDDDYVYYLLETRTYDYASGKDKKTFSGKRFIEVFVDELQKNIQTVIKDKTEFRPEYKKKENKILGKPVLYPYGMSSRILLRNLNTNEYKDGPTIENYTGSYHFTFTLPHLYAGDCSVNSKNHKFFANLVQWIEPLIASAYHSCDDRSVGNGNSYSKGSYRVAMTGWGSFGTSDLERVKCVKTKMSAADILRDFEVDPETFFEQETLFKYAYKDPKWRNNLPFKGLKDLEPCRKFLTGKQPSLGGDFRTPFFQEGYVGKNKNNDTVILKDYIHGLEIRIFDWFNPKHLSSMGRILVMVAEQSRDNHQEIFVYDDKDWNDAVRSFMIEGWKAQLSQGYVEKLEKVFNMKLNIKNYRAHDVFKTFVDVLFKKTKGGKWLNLMSKKHGTPPVLPNVNKKSWEFAFVQYMLENTSSQKKFISFTKSLKSGYSLKEIDIMYKKHFPGKKWKFDKVNMLEFLQSNKVLQISYTAKGNIDMIKTFNNNKDLNFPSIFNVLLLG